MLKWCSGGIECHAVIRVAWATSVSAQFDTSSSLYSSVSLIHSSSPFYRLASIQDPEWRIYPPWISNSTLVETNYTFSDTRPVDDPSVRRTCRSKKVKNNKTRRILSLLSNPSSLLVHPPLTPIDSDPLRAAWCTTRSATARCPRQRTTRVKAMHGRRIGHPDQKAITMRFNLNIQGMVPLLRLLSTSIRGHRDHRGRCLEG